MKTPARIYLSLIAIAMLAACAGASREEKISADITSADMAGLPMMESVKFTPPTVMDEETGNSLAAGTTATLQIKIPSKIRKTANLNITVDDYKKARTEIEKIIKTSNSYIGNENEQNSTYSITNDMVIRVVNKDFEGMVNRLLGVATNVNSKNISAEDVTAQFVDIQSRLKSKKEIEKRYLDILNKASKVTDVLEIEQKLGEIREEIEAKEGELKYLGDQVDYSTINLTFHQDFEYTPADKPGFFGRIGHAFGNGWNGFLSFLVGIVYAWPLWIILGGIAYFLVRFIRRKMKK
ncbi:MAG: DUF4349 domain-containing protein [Bacteroidetes bacterium]|nr:DUF4349 domain-containing protein [Bacteroidota bacterium]